MTAPVAPGEIVTWMGLSFETNASVLVPREETELLGRTARQLLDALRAEAAGDLRVIDMCCGSGNLACALAHAYPEGVKVWASDLTDACVALARANVARHALGDRVVVVQGDLFGSLAGAELEGSVDLVVCNPPYISTGKLASDSAHLLTDQPREAFDAGPYGIAIHKRVIGDAPLFLRPGGMLVMEIGLGQDKQIEGLVTRSKKYDPPLIVRDAGGAARVVTARRL